MPELHRALLVEDNEANQNYARIVLEKCGFAVDTAWNGAEAIKFLAERDYAVVLMDCIMPVMTGVEATKRIRDGSAKARNPNIPIIGITANAYQSNCNACMLAGMSDWITKPVGAEALREIVLKWAYSAVGEPLAA